MSKMNKKISDKVTAIIVHKLGVNPKKCIPEAEFTNDLGADSLEMVELILEFEKEFTINISNEDANKIKTFGQAIEYLELYTKG